MMPHAAASARADCHAAAAAAPMMQPPPLLRKIFRAAATPDAAIFADADDAAIFRHAAVTLFRCRCFDYA